MLKRLREKKTAKKVWILLAALIVPAFIFWGFSGALRSRGESAYAGRLFGRNIPLSEYRDALLAVRNMLLRQFGDKFTEAQKYFNLDEQAWERLILIYEAKRRNIRVSDQEVIRQIQNDPLFLRRGRFDSKFYEQIVRYDFQTEPRAYEEQVRQNLMLSKLYDTLTCDIKLSDAEIQEGYRKENEQISVYYLAAIPSDLAAGLSPKEQELKEFFAGNSLEFKEPPTFNVELVSSDSEEKIKKVAGRLKKKGDLAKAAAEAGLELKESGYITQSDSIPGIGWSPEISDLITKLKTNQCSSIIHVDKNYYIFRLKNAKEPYIPDFSAVKEKVKAAFIKSKTRALAKNNIENCLEKLKVISAKSPKRADFNALAKEYNLKSGSTPPFKFASYIEGIGISDNLWLAAYGLKIDESSGVIEMPTGFYIIKLKTRDTPDEKKFAAEKDDFGRKLLLQKKQEYFDEFAKELKRKMRLF